MFKNVFGFLVALQCAAILNADASPIMRHRSGNYGGGYILGQKVKASNTGLIFKTFELELNWGGFGDGRYLGSIESISTDSDRLFTEFDNLDPNQHYVFEIIQKHALNPEIEDSHFQLYAIHPVKSDFASSGLPSEMKVNNDQWRGGLSEGRRNGKIAEVERWGYFPTVCTVYMNLGGFRSGPQGGEHFTPFNVYSEEACSYIEKLMFYMVEVEIEYSQDYIEVWNIFSRTIERLKVVPGGSVANSNGGALPLSPDGSVTPEQYRTIKQMMMNDPEMIDFIKRQQNKLN